MKWFLLKLLLFLGFCSLLLSKSFTVNSEQSQVGFIAKKFAVVEVEGVFSVLEGTLEIEDNQLKNIDGFVNAASVNTKNTKRDKFLRSDKLFFNSPKFPKIVFKSNQINANVVNAKIRIKDFVKNIDFTIEKLKIQDRKLNLVLTGKVNRQDFKLNTHRDTIVADIVKVRANIVAFAK